ATEPHRHERWAPLVEPFWRPPVSDDSAENAPREKHNRVKFRPEPLDDLHTLRVRAAEFRASGTSKCNMFHKPNGRYPFAGSQSSNNSTGTGTAQVVLPLVHRAGRSKFQQNPSTISH